MNKNDQSKHSCASSGIPSCKFWLIIQWVCGNNHVAHCVSQRYWLCDQLFHGGYIRGCSWCQSHNHARHHNHVKRNTFFCGFSWTKYRISKIIVRLICVLAFTGQKTPCEQSTYCNLLYQIFQQYQLYCEAFVCLQSKVQSQNLHY